MKRTKTVLMGSVMDDFFRRPYIAAKIAEGRLKETYRNIVGDHVANLTTELKLDGKILHVKLTSSLLRQELFYQRDELRDELNRRSGVNFISAVIVK